MARDIHDTLAQGFTGVIVQLQATTGAEPFALTPCASPLHS
jgi:signal transduction histidine kinase